MACSILSCARTKGRREEGREGRGGGRREEEGGQSSIEREGVGKAASLWQGGQGRITVPGSEGTTRS